MMTIKHCMEVKAKKSFTASINRRRVNVVAGQLFWVTSTAAYAANYGVVDVARNGRGPGDAYAFTVENFNDCFEPV